jgi:hypothetical protein
MVHPVLGLRPQRLTSIISLCAIITLGLRTALTKDKIYCNPQTYLATLQCKPIFENSQICSYPQNISPKTSRINSLHQS